MQRSSLFLFSIVLALALRSRATLQTHLSEELGKKLGLPVDIEVVDSEKAPPPPAFLTKLYDCWSADGTAVADDCPSKKDFADDQETEVDLIRSFMGKHEEAAPPAVQSYNYDVELRNSLYVVFNSSCSMHHKEVIHSAELHIHKNGISESRLEELCPGFSSGVTVQLYSKIGTTASGSDVVSLSRRLTLGREEVLNSGSVIFRNLTGLYKDSFGTVFNRSHNNSVSIRIALEAPCQGVDPADLGFTTAKGKESAIISFFKSGPPSLHGMTMLAKTASQERQRRSVESSGEDSDPATVLTLEDRRRSHCNLYPYEVSFEELGWQDYIIMPESYMANYCVGRCQAPLSRNDNTTRHSYIQTIIHTFNPLHVPEACCVPSQLESLNVLYWEGPETITLQVWPDMRATACGCR